MNEPYIQALRDAIQKVHGCISRFNETVRIKEEADGQTTWEGNVEVFDLARHATARQCYAWGYKDPEGRWQYVTTLRVPPVDSARKAVQAFVASRGK